MCIFSAPISKRMTIADLGWRKLKTEFLPNDEKACS